MTTEFERRLRECLPTEAEVIGSDRRGALVPEKIDVIEASNGDLLSLSDAGRSSSPDGGKSWSEPETVRDTEGNALEGGLRHLRRLDSGAIGAFFTPRGTGPRWPGQVEGQFGNSLWFTASRDEGRTWSKPVMVSEPYNNAVIHGATVTSSGRIVASVYNMTGEHLREMWVDVAGSRALFGDEVVSTGPHGFDAFHTYCWVYYSDDEGQTWRSNAKRGEWAAGGELFVNLDYSAGGHWRANEPVLAEVSPGHLLMLQRTPLGRLFQSWSSDNGTTWSQSEPTALASALAPADILQLPGTGDLLVVWNQVSADEITRGLQRHRLSTAISKDGGATWLHGRNMFSIYGEDDRTFVEPPPIRNYRAMELSPRLPANDGQGTYPFLTIWKDRVITQFKCGFRVARTSGERDAGTGQPEESGWSGGTTYVSLPVSWFYERLRRFG